MSLIRPDIFISATSADLGPARQVVKEAILSLGCHPVEQSHFPPDYREIREILVTSLKECDAVIHLVGKVYGTEPVMVPEGQARRSYTQIEYDVARELDIPVYTFVAGDNFPYAEFEPEDGEKQRLQEAHREAVLGGDHKFTPFGDPAELHELALKLRTRVEKLEGQVEELDEEVGARKKGNWRLKVGILVGLCVIGLGVWAVVPHLAKQSEQIESIQESTERIEEHLARERKLLARVLREAGEKVAYYENLSPKERFDLATDAVASEQGLEAAELRDLINLFVVTVEADPEAGDLDKAMAAMARQQFEVAAELATSAGEASEAKMKLAQEMEEKAAEVKEGERKRAIEAYTVAGQAHFEAVRYEESLASYQAAARLTDKERDPVGWADGQLWVGRLYDELAEYENAVALLEEVLGAYEKHLKKDTPKLSVVLNNLAELLRKTNRHAEAEPLYRRALKIKKAFHGSEHPSVATSLNNLAELLRKTNRHAEAEPLYRRALSINEAFYGPKHPTVAIRLNNLALLLEATNRHTEAEPLYRRALGINKESYGSKHPVVSLNLHNLALLLKATNRQTAAEPLFRRALSINEASHGSEHPAVAGSLNSLAGVLIRTNRQLEAEPLFRRALNINEVSYGPEHPAVADNLNNLAELLRDTNRQAEAEPLYRRALRIDEASYGPEHPAVAIGFNNLASLLNATERQAEAEPLYRRALKVDEASYGPEHPDVARDLNNLALLLSNTNRPAEAVPIYRQAVTIFARSLTIEHPRTKLVSSNYKTLLVALKKTDAEIELALKEVQGNRDVLEPISPKLIQLLGPAKPVNTVLEALDREYREQGKPEVWFLPIDQPIGEHLSGLLRQDGGYFNGIGVKAYRRRAYAEASLLYEKALHFYESYPGESSDFSALTTTVNYSAALCELGKVEEARNELVNLLPKIEVHPDASPLSLGRTRYHLAKCEWLLDKRAIALGEARKSLAAYQAAASDEFAAVPESMMKETQDLIASLESNAAPPAAPSAAEGEIALDRAREVDEARSALAELDSSQSAATLLDTILGPAKSTEEVLDSLDEQYRREGRPEVYFLPADEPIAPHLDELLGPIEEADSVSEPGE